MKLHASVRSYASSAASTISCQGLIAHSRHSDPSSPQTSSIRLGVSVVITAPNICMPTRWSERAVVQNSEP